ncbi:MAG: pyruvate kinase [Planctomycetes bacterium]|nr:pyruvate kinase [Planctomycetota bacterium]
MTKYIVLGINATLTSDLLKPTRKGLDAMPAYTMRTQRGNPRRTKIVCTLGPASRSEERIAHLIDAGMNVARINCSHGSHDEHRETYARLRSVAAEMGRSLAILFDLSGPKIRVGAFDEAGIELKRGSRLTFVEGDGEGTVDAMTSTYPALITDLEVGDEVYLDDGNLRLRVAEKTESSAICVVEVGGLLKPRKGINLPGSRVSAPALTEKDEADLELAAELGADFVALSFVREAEHVNELRERLKLLNSNAQIVSKIEKPQAIENLEAIIEASDAVMVARGDLGVELPVERVPGVQRQIIRSAARHLKPVIVATQMMESMINSPRPTRAEVSDVANAIHDGCDAVMLSAETASGSYPIETVRTVSEVAIDTERLMIEERANAPMTVSAHGDPYRQAIVSGAEHIAATLHAKFIVVRSESGLTARYLSKLRGICPIIAANPDSTVLRRHALLWGVIPVKTAERDNEIPSMDVELAHLARELFRLGLGMPHDKMVVVSHFPWGEQRPPNSIRAIRIGDAIDQLRDPEY